jgi:aliphatic nitrilase
MGTWIIDNGVTLHTQRKLKPSGPEWDLFHSGTADTYAIVDSRVGALGALSCNENRRPLLRDKLYTMGQQIHVSASPCFALDVGIYGMTGLTSMESSAQYAGEGGITTLAPTLVASDAYHRMWPLPAAANYDNLKPGGGYAMIFDRSGKRIAEPLGQTVEGIVYADVPKADIVRSNDYDRQPFTIAANGLRP